MQLKRNYNLENIKLSFYYERKTTRYNLMISQDILPQEITQDHSNIQKIVVKEAFLSLYNFVDISLIRKTILTYLLFLVI